MYMSTVFVSLKIRNDFKLKDTWSGTDSAFLMACRFQYTPSLFSISNVVSEMNSLIIFAIT